MLKELEPNRICVPREFQIEDEPPVLIMDYGPVHHEEIPAVPLAAVPRPGDKAILALFCYDEPQSVIGESVAQVAKLLSQRQIAVHIFSRTDFELEAFGVSTHPMGECEGNDLLARVQEFGSRVCNAFPKLFDDVALPITLLGCEWSTLPALSLLRSIKTFPFILSLHSLERQRSDMTNELSHQIEAIEGSGLREARELLIHDPRTAKIAVSLVPECASRMTVEPLFPVQDFADNLDPGSIKARYQIAPLEPMILFVGDLDSRYGPDLLVKALPAVLKNHPHARLVVVGEGNLYWPLRVYARYLLLEHAVRLVGHVEGKALRELIQAADMVVVPSREGTPWWTIQAAWAARRPVVATHSAAPGLLEHERDAVLVYPSENSCVWGIERVLYDAELRKTLGEHGFAKLFERFSWGRIAAMIQEKMGLAATR